jgi:glycosyltransferase involved in cell wall biosynthesis
VNNILFLLRSLNLGGAERQLCTLAAGLQESGYSVKIAVFYMGGPLEAEARAMGIQIVDLKRRGRWDLFHFFLRLVRLIRVEKPDILHSYLQVPNIWSAFVKVVLPHVKIFWGIRASNVAMEKYGWQAQLTDRVESLLARIPDWIICNSHAGMRHAVEKGYPHEKLCVISNGTDTERFFPDRESGLQLRKQWGVEANQKLIGMVGRMDPMKDYPNFLRAASLLVQEREDIRFVCVGGGPDRYIHEYRDLARSLNLERFLIWAGEQGSMLNIYNSLDILALTSAFGEGFSNAIGEAMACGVPCVATDVGDAARLIGTLGEIVPPGDSEALKRGILTLLNRLENETNLAAKVTQRITEQFNMAKLISRTTDILNQVFAAKDLHGEETLRSDPRL